MAVGCARVSGVCLVVLVTLFIGSTSAAKKTERNGVANKLYVKFGPNGPTKESFFSMPRSVKDSEYASNGFKKVAENKKDKSTSVHCPKDGTRVCLVMNSCGVTVGYMISIKAKELDQRVPDAAAYENLSQVFKQKLLGEEVHSCIIYITREDKRNVCNVTASSPTAPDGLFIWQKRGEMSIPTKCSALEKVGLCKQGCYPAMGFHYTKNICSNKKKCEDLSPFTILCDQKSGKINGFVFSAFGSKVNEGKWIEKYYEAGFKITTPNAQQCIYDYANRYYINTIHFYLVNDPWKTLQC